jgi:hypothetical protein
MTSHDAITCTMLQCKKVLVPQCWSRKLEKTKNFVKKGETCLDLHVKMRLLWQCKVTWRYSWHVKIFARDEWTATESHTVNSLFQILKKTSEWWHPPPLNARGLMFRSKSKMLVCLIPLVRRYGYLSYKETVAISVVFDYSELSFNFNYRECMRTLHTVEN